MPAAENLSEGPAGLNWTPQYLQKGDFRPRSTFADRMHACMEKVRPVDENLAQQLKGSIDQLVRNTVTVTFGGRFNSGKSTLVNRLLGREILPVNVEPETGAPCFIQTAPKDRASAFQSGRMIEIPCNTESLRGQLSLWRRTTGQSQTELATRVELELAGVPIPAEARWIDTPGLDESVEMDTASLGVFRHTDILIWVLSSDAALSIQEIDYIRDHVQDAGPRGVVFSPTYSFGIPALTKEAGKHS